jgi:hypothetical protein
MKCVHGESRIFLVISLFFVDFNTDLHFNGGMCLWVFSPFSPCVVRTALSLSLESLLNMIAYTPLRLRQKVYNGKKSSIITALYIRADISHAGLTISLLSLI